MTTLPLIGSLLLLCFHNAQASSGFQLPYSKVGRRSSTSLGATVARPSEQRWSAVPPPYYTDDDEDKFSRYNAEPLRSRWSQKPIRGGEKSLASFYQSVARAQKDSFLEDRPRPAKRTPRNTRSYEEERHRSGYLQEEQRYQPSRSDGRPSRDSWQPEDDFLDDDFSDRLDDYRPVKGASDVHRYQDYVREEDPHPRTHRSSSQDSWRPEDDFLDDYSGPNSVEYADKDFVSLEPNNEDLIQGSGRIQHGNDGRNQADRLSKSSWDPPPHKKEYARHRNPKPEPANLSERREQDWNVEDGFMDQATPSRSNRMEYGQEYGGNNQPSSQNYDPSHYHARTTNKSTRQSERRSQNQPPVERFMGHRNPGHAESKPRHQQGWNVDGFIDQATGGSNRMEYGQSYGGNKQHDNHREFDPSRYARSPKDHRRANKDDQVAATTRPSSSPQYVLHESRRSKRPSSNNKMSSWKGNDLMDSMHGSTNLMEDCQLRGGNKPSERYNPSQYTRAETPRAQSNSRNEKESFRAKEEYAHCRNARPKPSQIPAARQQQWGVDEFIDRDSGGSNRMEYGQSYGGNKPTKRYDSSQYVRAANPRAQSNPRTERDSFDTNNYALHRNPNARPKPLQLPGGKPQSWSVDNFIDKDTGGSNRMEYGQSYGGNKPTKRYDSSRYARAETPRQSSQTKQSPSAMVQRPRKPKASQSNWNDVYYGQSYEAAARTDTSENNPSTNYNPSQYQRAHKPRPAQPRALPPAKQAFRTDNFIDDTGGSNRMQYGRSYGGLNPLGKDTPAPYDASRFEKVQTPHSEPSANGGRNFEPSRYFNFNDSKSQSRPRKDFRHGSLSGPSFGGMEDPNY